MIRKTFFCLGMLLISASLPHEVNASDRKYTSHVGATAELHDLHFTEVQNGEPLNEETGALLFSGGGIHWQTSKGLFGEVFFKQAEDTLDYRGYSQLGQLVASTTEYYISDVSLLLGRDFGATGAFIGVNHHYRERNILADERVGVAGLYEEMDTINGVFGLRAALFRHSSFQLRLEARVATGIDSSLYFNDEDFDPVTISPGKQMTYRVAVEIFYNAFAGVVLSLIPAYEYASIDKSKEYRVFIDGVPAGVNAHLPAAEWESYSLTTKLSWYF